MIPISIFLLISFIALLAYLRNETLERGKEEKENEIDEATLGDVYLAKKARDLLNSSSDASDKLRDKYTRK